MTISTAKIIASGRDPKRKGNEMKLNVIPDSEIKWTEDHGVIACDRVGIPPGSLPPVILVYGRYRERKFYKDVDMSLQNNCGYYISECQTYTLEII